jgi:hypothetical protein
VITELIRDEGFASPLTTVCGDCSVIGFVIARGCDGFEGFDRSETSLGKFADKQRAIAAVTTIARVESITDECPHDTSTDQVRTGELNMTKRQDIVSAQSQLSLPTRPGTDGLAKYGASEGNTSLGDWLKCNGKTGVLSYGSQGTELPSGTKAAVLLGLGEAGFILWEDGRRADQAWVRLVDGPDLKELRQTLPDNDPARWTETTPSGQPQDPFRESVKLPLVLWPGGKLLTYSTSAGSGVKAVKSFVRGCVAQIRAAPEMTADRAPLVELVVGNYLHPLKEIGKIFYLMFEVCDWIPAGQVMHALVAQGDAGALGIPNDPAMLNAALGMEPGADQPPTPTRKGHRFG